MDFFPYVSSNDINGFTQWNHGWIAAVVEPFCEWPSSECLTSPKHLNASLKDEYTFLLKPFNIEAGKIYLPLVATKNRNNNTFAKKKLLDFISSLSYFHDEAIIIKEFLVVRRYQTIRSNLQINCHSNLPIQDNFYTKNYLVEKGNNLKLAMALFREGINLHKIGNPFYAVLSLYKIFEALESTRCERSYYIASLKKYSFEEAIKEEKEIYKAFRCAIAHADLKKSIKNPDNIFDIDLTFKKFNMIREIAKMAINQRYVQQRFDGVLPSINCFS